MSKHNPTTELHNIPEHSAQAAATKHDKAPHLTAHEETVQAEDQSRNVDKVTHGPLTHGKGKHK